MDIAFVQHCCNALPAVTESIKWENNLVFSIGSKMFCMAALDPPFRCSFKVTDEEFDEWSNRKGFIPAPYMARAKWVTITDPSQLNKKEWEEALLQSYQLVKDRLTKKRKAELGIE